MVHVTPQQAAQALNRIRAAERDLGKLSPGQRRDLLKDNTDWDGPICDAAADLITEMDGGSKAVCDASYGPGGWNEGMERKPGSNR